MSLRPPDLEDRFSALFDKISSERFLAKVAVGNEVPFFISAYDPRHHYAVMEAVGRLTRKLASAGVEVLTLELYRVCMDYFASEGLTDAIATLEKDGDYEALQEAVVSALDWDSVLAPRIAERFAERPQARVTFVTEIGQVYPYLRSGELLNRMQVIAKDTPTVFFYPGAYDQRTIKLFGEIESEHYYRAFNLADYRV